MKAGKVNTLKLTDSGYPELLRHIASPPQAIYFIGSDPSTWLKQPKLAIVGSRKVSVYGEAVTQRLSSQLASLGVVIISGLAYGVDSIAHQAAINAGGITAAILAGGLDSIYPSSNRHLAEKLLNTGGTILSEYPPGTPSYRQNFIARNRIVSGLAEGLLITEASVKSGTLHTAKFALEQGRSVMAVPGNITSPGSEGTNNLIKSGASAVTSADDVLFNLDLEFGQARQNKVFSVSPSENIVIQLIRDGLSDQEDLALASKLDSAEFSSVLTMLEISGYIRALGGGHWTLA